MAVKFQYNKVSMQQLQKELKIRINALPTLKSKEAYLRVTIKKQKELLHSEEARLEKKLAELNRNAALWAEFPMELVRFESVELKEDNVAGIKVPALETINYQVLNYSAFLKPAWLAWGIEAVKQLVEIVVEITIMHKRIDMLEYARKKTTQKVNLYEKVQIPEFSESILKIKRYLEDVENLEKAAQKITKSRALEGVSA
jgi:V/A-type H+/Na+-transporting ATPase subunit D